MEHQAETVRPVNHWYAHEARGCNESVAFRRSYEASVGFARPAPASHRRLL